MNFINDDHARNTNVTSRITMGTVRVAVRYDGKWINKEGNLIYEGGKTKGILLANNIAYEELQDTVCRALDINRSDYAIMMKFRYKMSDVAPPIEVLNDTDVDFFIAEVSDVMTRNSLCISVERKRDSIGCLPVGDEECLNNTFVQFAAEKYLDSEGPYNIERTMSDEDVRGDDNYGKDIFDQFGSEVVDVCTPTKGCPEASPIDRGDNWKDNKLKSEMVKGDCQVGTTSLIHLAADGGRSASLFDSVTEVRKGDIFSSKEELQLNIRMLATGRQFNIKMKKSTKDLLVLGCVEKGCKWWLRATKLAGSEAFCVRKYLPDHTCSLDSLILQRAKVTSKLIGHCIKWKYEGASQSYRPNDIVQDMKKSYGMTCTYNKAWRAREVALTLARGSPEESYTMLPFYCALLERQNSGTIIEIECDASNRFKYFFMALGGSLHGFRSFIRPVIAVDDTFLKSKYKGTLFIATCMDGNNQVYPLAFGVGDSENDNAWIWFMTKLHGCIGDIDDVVFISDRNTSIATVVAHSFPGALHGICMYHLGQNMKANCKGADVQKLFYKAVKAYRASDFNAIMSQIHGLSVQAAEYLIVADPTKWAICEFEGRRYSIMTTNIAECLNAILKEARELPITKLIEHIRGVLQRWFWQKHADAAITPTPMTRWVEEKLRHRMKKAGRYPVRPIDIDRYLVIDEFLNPVVNLRSRTCECKKFQIDQLPCAHALTVCSHRHVSCYDYCAAYYTRDSLAAAHAASIHPVGCTDDWILPEGLQVPTVLPPVGRKPRGRPSTKRKPSKGEDKKKAKCSRYGGFGHNRQRCTAPIPI